MVSEKVIKEINENPELLSALYDINLLPEQVVTKEQSNALTCFVSGFALGRKRNQVTNVERG